jgi:hypothetical protein
VTPAAQHGVAEASEALGRRKRRWSLLEKASSGRVVGNTATAVLAGNVTIFFYFILRNGGVRTVGRLHCSICETKNTCDVSLTSKVGSNTLFILLYLYGVYEHYIILSTCISDYNPSNQAYAHAFTYTNAHLVRRIDQLHIRIPVIFTHTHRVYTNTTITLPRRTSLSSPACRSPVSSPRRARSGPP